MDVLHRAAAPRGVNDARRRAAEEVVPKPADFGPRPWLAARENRLVAYSEQQVLTALDVWAPGEPGQPRHPWELAYMRAALEAVDVDAAITLWYGSGSWTGAWPTAAGPDGERQQMHAARAAVQTVA